MQSSSGLPQPGRGSGVARRPVGAGCAGSIWPGTAARRLHHFRAGGASRLFRLGGADHRDRFWPRCKAGGLLLCPMATNSQITSRPDSENSCRRQAVAVVEHVKGADPSTIVELIAGEVERPTLVHRLRHDGGRAPMARTLPTAKGKQSHKLGGAAAWARSLPKDLNDLLFDNPLPLHVRISLNRASPCCAGSFSGAGSAYTWLLLKRPGDRRWRSVT